MKVINLSFDDYANFAFANCEALVSVGIDAISLKKKPHPFSYDQESRIASDNEIMRGIQEADVVQLFHSDHTWLKYAHNLNKRIMVYHTGTSYRMNSQILNHIFNDKVERCFTDQCEFIGMGMKNETYIATAVDTEKIKPSISDKFPLPLFAHYPSNPDVKGTAKIKELLEHVFEGVSLGGDECFDIQTNRLPHPEQLKRMSECYCYIELFAPTQNGKPYGCFGVTAFEAAAMGRVVITNNIHKEVYENAYGECALIIANTQEEFISSVIDIMNLEGEAIMDLMKKSFQWIQDKHSYKATGNYLKKFLTL